MQILFVVQIAITVALIATVLMQRSSQDGMSGLGGGGGAGAGGGSGFLSGRAQANLLTRTTAILAVLFMANSLILAYLASHTDRGVSAGTIAEKIAAEESQIPTEAPKQESIPQVPIAE